jgi:hypothetical protein
MPEIEHTSGPGRFNHGSVGVSEHGDTFVVSDDTAEYLCDELGHFTRTDEVPLDDDEYSVEEQTNDQEAEVPFNPENYTIDEIESKLDDVDDPLAVQGLKDLEEEQQGRDGAEDAFDARLNELEG